MIKWKIKTGRYDNGISGSVGNIRFFSVDWDSGTPPRNEEGEILRYKLNSPVIQYKGKTNFLTEKEAQDHAEKLLEKWLDMAGLQQKGEIYREEEKAKYFPKKYGKWHDKLDLNKESK